VAASYRLTVRDGPRVARERFGSLEAALDALAERAAALQDRPARAAVDLRVRRFEPVEQVAARAEVSGPGRLLARVRAGVDVRGDGSAEPWVGRFGRRVVERREGESCVVALRRELGVSSRG